MPTNVTVHTIEAYLSGTFAYSQSENWIPQWRIFGMAAANDEFVSSVALVIIDAVKIVCWVLQQIKGLQRCREEESQMDRVGSEVRCDFQ